MSVWTQPSPSDFDRWEELLVKGVEPASAARELGFTASAFRRSDPERHAECLALGREAREAIANNRGEKWALDDDAPPQIRLAYLKAESSRYRQGDTSNVEVNHGGVVTVEHERRLTIGDLAAYARSLDGPVDRPVGELPAARPLLAEPAEGELPAGGDAD